MRRSGEGSWFSTMPVTPVGNWGSVLMGRSGRQCRACIQSYPNQSTRMLTVCPPTPRLSLVLWVVTPWHSQPALQAGQETMLQSPPQKQKSSSRKPESGETGKTHLP